MADEGGVSISCKLVNHLVMLERFGKDSGAGIFYVIATRAIERHCDSTAWQYELKQLQRNKRSQSSRKGRRDYGGGGFKVGKPQRS